MDGVVPSDMIAGGAALIALLSFVHGQSKDKSSHIDGLRRELEARMDTKQAEERDARHVLRGDMTSLCNGLQMKIDAIREVAPTRHELHELEKRLSGNIDEVKVNLRDMRENSDKSREMLVRIAAKLGLPEDKV